MRITRRQVVTSAAALGGIGATACGGAAGSPAAIQRKEPVKLSLSTDWTAGLRADTVKRWTVEFPKTNPNVKEVEIWTAPAEGTTAGAYNIKVQTAIAAGSGPDVMMEVWPAEPATILVQLDSYLQKKKFNKADYWWSKYYQETADGKIFSLPMGAYVGGMVANVDMFERAGVPLPQKDWTFNDMREIARKLKVGKAWGMERQVGAWDQGWTNRFASEGAEWYDRQTLKTGFATGKDGGKPQEMFEDWWGLVWRDRVAPNPDEVKQVQADAGVTSGPLFATGLIGMSGLPFYQAGILRDAVQGKFRWRALWPPKSPYSGRRGYHLETNCISINKTAKDVDLAVELGYYWLTDDMSSFLASNLPVMPPARKWHRSKEVQSMAPGMEIFGDVADEAQKIGSDRHKYQGGTGASPKSLQFLSMARAPLEMALNTGSDPRVALRDCVAAGDRALA
ncbi:MAG TPA: extracellular solute-binding protein [Chloroflexota bacterium]|nr:extracellular solute-binding protein [Chloroflexota bacterium]